MRSGDPPLLAVVIEAKAIQGKKKQNKQELLFCHETHKRILKNFHFRENQCDFVANILGSVFSPPAKQVVV